MQGSEVQTRACPGCGLMRPQDETMPYTGYYHASPECWTLYTEVLGREFGNAVLFGQVHQLTVDTYAVQHAGGRHPDKSVDVHLVGLHLVLEKGLAPSRVPPLLQRLASRVREWPRFMVPESRAEATVLGVAQCGNIEGHAEGVKTWAREVWALWTPAHREVAELARQALKE